MPFRRSADDSYIKGEAIRLGVVVFLLVAAYVAALGKVYYLQAVESADLSARSSTKENFPIKMNARRGNILDRNGVELAISVEVPTVAARPREIENPEREARRLMPHLELPYETILAKLTSKSPFVYLQRRARPASAKAIEDIGIPGVSVTFEYKRYYPLQHRAGQLLGFVDIDGLGREGVEKLMDKDLSGGTYELTVTRDARGKQMLTASAPRFRDFEGKTVRLTIDERVQAVAEDALRAQVERYSAKGGYAVVVDVHTGEVLAMANTPQFDSNMINQHVSDDWRLRCITDTFEPGSVIKPFVLGAALQEGTVKLHTPFQVDNGQMRIGTHTIRDTKPKDVLTAAEIIQISSNIGSYKIAQTIGREKLYEYIRGLGFGVRTNIGLSGEQGGLLRAPDRWPEIMFANVSFGQGMSSTPLQLAMATAAVANGGNLMQPRVIHSVLDRDGGVIRETYPTLVRKVFSPEVARQTAWSMSLVTMEGGTGTRAALTHHTVAAKTGTAQKVNSETRRYDPSMWLATFVGFVPAERPEIAIAIVIDEPQEVHYGGVVAGPAFARIAENALSLRGVVPVPPAERFHLHPRAQAMTEGAGVAVGAPAALAPAPALPAALAGPVGPASPAGQEAPALAEPVDERTIVPDFTHFTLRQAIERAATLDVLPKVDGWGRVVSQIPPPGMPWGEERQLRLVLSPATRQALIADEPSSGPSH